VALIQEVRAEYGLAPALVALNLARSTWHYHQAYRIPYTTKYAHLRGPLEAIARKHPEYGYRRTLTELRETHGQFANHKVVERLHRQWGLPLIRTTRPPRPSGIRTAIAESGERANLEVSLERIGPFEVLYTDFTEILYAAGKAFLIAILDHLTKVVLGWAAGEAATSSLALEAWRKTKRTLARFGLRPQGIIVHHDQDSVFTSYAWTGALLLKDGARISYALRGAKDNPEMESFFGRFKQENHSLFLDASNLTELLSVLSQRLTYYNNQRRHSSLGNVAPMRHARSLFSKS